MTLACVFDRVYNMNARCSSCGWFKVVERRLDSPELQFAVTLWEEQADNIAKTRRWLAGRH